MQQKQYNAAGLERLYQAIKEQAEQEFIEAIHRDFPDMGLQEEMFALKFYRRLSAKAEQRIIEQSRGNEG